MEEIKPEASNQEEGEEQLASLIKQAGNEARKRRKKTLDEHYKKIKAAVSEAVSRQKE
jgi:DNA-binding protein YbaB